MIKRNDTRTIYTCCYCGGDFMHKPFKITDIIKGVQHFYHSERCWGLKTGIEIQKQSEPVPCKSTVNLGVIK